MAEPAAAPPEQGVDALRLATMLKALASPVRVELLQQLRTPRTLADIQLRTHRRDRERSGRLMSSVTVRQHLDSLLRIGAARLVRLTRDGRLMNHYMVDHRQLFALTEELRQLARIRPDADLLPDGTMPGPPPDGPAAPTGPRLLAVNGVREGKAYPLHAAREEWLIGRDAEADVALDYDPYVSLRHARLQRAGRGFEVVDLPGSRNGTAVNGQALPKGSRRALAVGDVVGVGRSALVLQA